MVIRQASSRLLPLLKDYAGSVCVIFKQHKAVLGYCVPYATVCHLSNTFKGLPFFKISKTNVCRIIIRPMNAAL
mgnify:CR=1 FL=1